MSGKVTIVKKKRFFDRYADITNTARKTIRIDKGVSPTVVDGHEQEVNFDWRLGDVKQNDREPVTIYDPQDLGPHGIAVNSRLLTVNGIDTSILTEKQVEQLLRSRPLVLRFATRKRGDKGASFGSKGRGRGGGGGGRWGNGGGSSSSNHAGFGGGSTGSVLDDWRAQGPKPSFSFDSNRQFLGEGGPVASSEPVQQQPASAGDGGMQLQRDMGHRNTSYAGVTETADAREARRRRFETWAVKVEEEQKDAEDDEEEVITIGPVVGKSEELEKSYLRLTDAAKAAAVRAQPILEQAFERLKQVEKEKTWHYVSDQLRAIRQDLQVQNIENEFTAKVYMLNAQLALKNRDLGQFHQCAMQLRSLSSKMESSAREEISLLRAVYNCFMGIEQFRVSMGTGGGGAAHHQKSLEDEDEQDLVPPTSPVTKLLQAFRLKNFAGVLRLRAKCSGSLGDLCGCFDNQFRCQALIRLLSAFKVEKPNYEVLSWLLNISEPELTDWLVRVALIKDLANVTKAVDLRDKIKDSVAMNIRHQMK